MTGVNFTNAVLKNAESSVTVMCRARRISHWRPG